MMTSALRVDIIDVVRIERAVPQIAIATAIIKHEWRPFNPE